MLNARLKVILHILMLLFVMMASISISVYVPQEITRRCRYATSSRNIQEKNVIIDNDVEYQYHYITKKGVNEIMKKIGVREKNKNYNRRIGEHSTGLAPPTERGLKDLIGKKVLDRVVLKRALKSSVRWDLDPHFPPVKSQGSQGSCSA